MYKFFQKYALFFLILVAVAVRIPLLNGSFWLDEAAQMLESARSFSEQLNIAKDFQPPLFHYLIFFALRMHASEWFVRLVGALIPGVLTVVMTYLFTKKLWNTTTAVLTTALVATSSFHVYFSQELRPYSLAAFWGLLSSYLLLRICTENGKKIVLKASFVLVTIAGLYTMYLYPFVLFGQLVSVGVVYTKKIKTVLALSAAGLLAFVPWLPYFLTQLQVGQQLRTDLPGWGGVVGTPFIKSLPLTLGKFLYGVLNIEFTVWYLLPVVLLLTSLFLQRRALYLAIKDTKTKYALLLLGVTLGTAWLVSGIIPVLQPKRVLVLLPIVYGLIVHILVVKRTFGRAVFILLLGIQLTALYAYWTTPQLQRENWRSLHRTIITQYPSNTVVVFAFPDSFAPWDWYDAGRTPRVVTPYTTQLELDQLEQKLKRVTEYDYVLVFDYLRDLTDPERKVEQSLYNLGFAEREKIDGGSIGFVRVFSRRAAVLSYVQESTDHNALSRY